MKVFVIGATGYIGNTVAERLLESGNSVVGLARTDTASERLKKAGIEPHMGDLRNPSTIVPALKKVDAAVHAGTLFDDLEDVKRGKSHLSELLAAFSGTNKKFVFTSGTGVLLDTGDQVYDEATRLPSTDLPVTLSRRAAETTVLSAASAGVHSMVLRPPVVYGRAGSYLIPKDLISHAVKKGESVYIEDTENNKWSTVHVDDLADLFLICLNKAKPGTLWHTTAESGVTTISIAESISRLVGLGGKTKAISLDKARHYFDSWADFFKQNNQSSARKAMNELGWKPHRKSLTDDIEHGSYRDLVKKLRGNSANLKAQSELVDEKST